jgi:molecular chaperone DnaK
MNSSLSLKKGTSIPVSGSEKFRAARNLRAGDNASLDIELYEQADGVDDPDLNLPIGAFRLSSNDLGPGDVIRRGDDIFVRWRVDANGLLNCTIDFSSISQSHETGKMYVSTAGHKSFDGEDGLRLAADALRAAEGDVDQLERALGSLVAENVIALRKRLSTQIETLRLAHDADTRRAVSEEARLIRQEVSRLKSRPEFSKEVVRAEIDELMESYSIDLAPVVDTKINTQVNRLAGLARDALQKEGPHAANDARQSLDEIRALIIGALAKKSDFWIGMFEDMANRRHQAVDKKKHDDLVRKGEAAISKDDIDELRHATALMRDNMVKSVESARINILSGLMR